MWHWLLPAHALTGLSRPRLAVVLTESEQQMYREAHAKSKALFQQYRTLSNSEINKHLLQIMALLLPMRRVCSGEPARLLAPVAVLSVGWLPARWWRPTCD